ncbi:MAG: copper homeostasis protein CutC [Propionibacteriaceae bacterium]|nr:copper homeostasis protein CutC [Propionibacteriaceae bacterium]
MVVREFCAENFTLVPAAIAAGADRIELCDNLAVGGTSPSLGVLGATIHYAHQHGAAVFTMIRPRRGDFHYRPIELAMMGADILQSVERGVDGVVLGLLNADGWIDEAALAQLMTLAGGVDVTFHMAFDQIARERQFAAIDRLVELGVSRILSHGGPSGSRIVKNLSWLKQLVQYAEDRLAVIVGGGVSVDNAAQVAAATGASQLHGTKLLGRLNDQP